MILPAEVRESDLNRNTEAFVRGYNQAWSGYLASSAALYDTHDRRLWEGEFDSWAAYYRSLPGRITKQRASEMVRLGELYVRFSDNFVLGCSACNGSGEVDSPLAARGICAKCDGSGRSRFMEPVDIRRMKFLPSKVKPEDEDAGECIEAALTLRKQDFEAFLKEREGHPDPDRAAQEEAAARYEKMRERKLGEFLALQKWTSKRFRAYCRTLPCCFSGLQDPKRVEGHHVRPKGRGGDDLMNIAPIAHDIHRLIEDKHWQEVAVRYLDFKPDPEMGGATNNFEAMNWAEDHMRQAAKSALIAYLTDIDREAPERHLEGEDR